MGRRGRRDRNGLGAGGGQVLKGVIRGTAREALRDLAAALRRGGDNAEELAVVGAGDQRGVEVAPAESEADQADPNGSHARNLPDFARLTGFRPRRLG
jgi:hypothetical protein